MPGEGAGDQREERALELGVGESRGEIQDGVVVVATARVAHGDVRLVQGVQAIPEGILHARTPVAGELALENGQTIGDGRIPVPAEPDVKQVEAEGAFVTGNVEEDDVSATLRWNEAEGTLRE